MSNYPEQLDFFYSNQLYLSCPYLTHPSLSRSGCALIPLTSNQDFLDQSRDLHKVDHLFLMLQKQGNRMEGFFFIKENLTPAECPIFLGYIDLLKKFGKHFKREAKPLIQQALDDGYNMHKAKGNAFLSRDPSLPLSNRDPHVASFLNQVSPLTPQERHCLDLFHQGKSGQATAAIMGLSQRTVEHYFENMKNKLGCSSKWDLLDW